MRGRKRGRPGNTVLIWGYNTNGFAHHRLADAIRILHALGYRAVGITLDYHHLNPFNRESVRELYEVRRLLERTGMRCVIETGARFLLDPWRKHWPTLVDPLRRQRERRLRFLCKAVDIAAHLGADAVSIWSGVRPNGVPEPALWRWLEDGCRRLCDYAAEQRVLIGFEPEPGMLIERLADFDRLRQSVCHPALQLTLDVGHVHCLDDGPPEAAIHRYREVLVNVHVEDMRKGVHDHLAFGEGTMRFEPILAALVEIGYNKGVYVELSRHSHNAVRTAEQAIRFLERTRRRCLTGELAGSDESHR